MSDSYEVMKSMGLSAAVSVKSIGYKVSGKASFAKNSKVSGYSSNFVLRASVDNGVRYAAPLDHSVQAKITSENEFQRSDSGAIRLTPEALKLAKKKDQNAFTNVCGDSFVSALYGGAELIADSSQGKTSEPESAESAESASSQ